jgi:hypothetical protein
MQGTTLPRPAYVEAVRVAPGPVLNLPFPCTTEFVHEQIWHGQPLLGGMAEHASALRPPGVEERLQGDSLLSALIGAGNGRGLGGSLEEPTDLARWLVFHKAVYAGSPLARQCWPEEQGPQRNDRALQELVLLLGPAQVDDAHAAAWDLVGLGLSTMGGP